MNDSLFQIFIGAVLANNFVLAMFLGLCPFLGVSKKLDTAFPMGCATTFVMFVASLCAFAVNKILVSSGLEFLRLISYIVIIASAVQLVEMVTKKYSPTLFRALGIYLPLITTNCAVLGVALIVVTKEFSFGGSEPHMLNLVESLVYALSTAVGYGLAMVLFAGIRETLSLNSVPKAFKGVPIALISAGIMAMAFMGFSGIVK